MAIAVVVLLLLLFWIRCCVCVASVVVMDVGVALIVAVVALVVVVSGVLFVVLVRGVLVVVADDPVADGVDVGFVLIDVVLLFMCCLGLFYCDRCYCFVVAPDVAVYNDVVVMLIIGVVIRVVLFVCGVCVCCCES